MRRNTEAVFIAWMARKPLGGRSISTDGNRIFSYQTCIVERQGDGRVLVNRTKYSPTTSQQQSALAEAIGYGLELRGVPRNTQELAPYAVGFGEDQGTQDQLNTEREGR
jgi:hypothetical protein